MINQKLQIPILTKQLHTVVNKVKTKTRINNKEALLLLKNAQRQDALHQW